MTFVRPLHRKPASAARPEAMGCRVAGVTFDTEGANAWTVR